MSTYYKVLPEDLICREFQYHEGLNIDINPIDEEKYGYGLHFSDAAHIMNFCDFGSMIAEVEIPEDATVYHFGEKSKADRIILKTFRPLWSVDTIKALIQEGVEFESYKNFMLREAASRGVLDVVKFLAEHGVNIHKDYENALCIASDFGHLDIVKYLVEHGSDIHAVEDYPLRWASHDGHYDIVLYLVEQGANIHAWDDWALGSASALGHFDVVKYLVEHGANIHANDDYAIRHAGTPEIKVYLKSLS